MKLGDTFGDYKVIRLLGKGGMGEVWLLEGKSGRQVAAKILEAGADHESRKRFLREAQLALGVKNPNLVEAYDVGIDPASGLCYILMEYVSGGTLADLIKARGALPIEEAVSIVQAMASVLELGRQKGIVHRDIKPANIMFDAEGTPKLADLGIARAGNAGTETTTVTQTGAMIGTPAYMAPEQMLDSHNVDTRADIYSLGVVFYEMLTGERPNKDDTAIQLMARAIKGEPLPDVRTLRPEVSASLAQLLNMMVAPKREGRIATPGQITSAIDVIQGGGVFSPPRTPADSEARPTVRSWPKRFRIVRRFHTRDAVFFLVAVVALMAACGAALALWRGRPQDSRVLQVRKVRLDGPAISAALEPQDLRRMTEKMVDSLLADRETIRGLSGGIMEIGEIQNRTSLQIDTTIVTDSLRTKLLRSRVFRFQDVQSNAVDQPGDPKEHQKKGRPVRMVIYGSLVELSQKAGDTLDRYFKFTLNIKVPSTGEIVWSDESEMRKQATRKHTRE